MELMPKVGFIGAGTVGTALALRLSQHRYQIAAVASRNLTSAQKLAEMLNNCRICKTPQEVADVAQFVFITTPDDFISRVAAEIHWHVNQSVVHCSGADSVDILAPAKQLGAEVGCFHPLQTFASVSQAISNLPGSTFAIEAEEPLLSTLKEMARALDGDYVELKAGDKVLYHVAAVFACNYVVTLVKLATDLWQTFGVSRAQATKALIPLLRGTVNNIGSIGLPDCLTGPIARGDLGTINRHQEALEKKAPSLLTIYKELGLHTVPIALAKGKIDKSRAEELQALLEIKLKDSGGQP